MDMSLNLNLSLSVPLDSADGSAVVVDSKGMPIGQKGQTAGEYVVSQLGWSSEDILELSDTEKADLEKTINELVELTGATNISVQITQDAEGNLDVIFNNIDPSNPTLPVNTAYFEISNNSAANLASRANAEEQVQKESDPTTKAQAQTKGASAAHQIAGNIWLSGNPYTLFVTLFNEMRRIMQQSKAVEGTREVKMLNMIVEIAKDMASQIMKAARQQFAMHVAGACMAGVSFAIGVASMGCMAYSSSRLIQERMQFNNTKGSSLDPKTQNEVFEAQPSTVKLRTMNNMANAMVQVAMSMNQMVTQAVQASVDIPAAKIEGYKQILQAYQQVIQHIMEKASQRFKEDTEMIQQLISNLDSIRQKLQEAIAAALRR